MEDVISTEICKKCAECCKKHPFIELSQREVDSIAKLTGLPIAAFTYSKDKTVGGKCLQFEENGDCFFLTEDSGSYSCAVYEARPGICANYPSNPKQQEACDLNRQNLNIDLGCQDDD